ncbi:hypothetical protein OHA98_41375 [Streptomyces sp. NBC_00654]|uniref:hypothetical protein n=1 Tax=Streptomyces sp. NBC_00654 TaxID=2975799 RepID=UPI00225608DF|nr:hypothetical protein [Streptomyces sp. NBC_00654]MCX4971065.1 hypothetical protein [Streptomyces sp. NBC_00654]
MLLALVTAAVAVIDASARSSAAASTGHRGVRPAHGELIEDLDTVATLAYAAGDTAAMC